MKYKFKLRKGRIGLLEYVEAVSMSVYLQQEEPQGLSKDVSLWVWTSIELLRGGGGGLGQSEACEGNRAIVGEIGLPASKRARGRETHLLERPPRPGGIVQGKQAHEAQGFNFKSLGFEIGSQNTFSLSTIMHDNITGKRRLYKNRWMG